MVKFNPGLSQILNKIFLSKNMLLEITKSFCVFTPRFSDDNIESVTLGNAKEGKYESRTNFLIWD